MDAKQLPLMPKATAVWLIDSTSLTFEQIADFCGMHVLEVKGIADGDVAYGILPMDPIQVGQLDKEDITKCEENPSDRLVLKAEVRAHLESAKKSRFTPRARRQDKPNAIAWLIANAQGITNAQIIKLIGTTKKTIESIVNKTHRNFDVIQARDPVLIGLCSQSSLDRALEVAQKSFDKKQKEAAKKKGEK